PQLRELVPCHCTATGKALLSWREAWRESVLERPLERFTEHTVTDPKTLRAEAEAIRERGYALEACEYQDGIHAVASPVFSSGNEATAAPGACGGDVARFIDRVVARAGELTEARAGA